MKQIKFLVSDAWINVYANDFDTDMRALVPELWAQEALLVLDNSLVAAQLINRDYENIVADFGDVINLNRPGRFSAVRKGINDDVTVQDATAEKIQVKLDQFIHTSFLIRDGEESLSFDLLRAKYLVPAIESIAQFIDQIVLLQMYQFLENTAGKLGTDPSRTTIIQAREVMNKNNVPEERRRMIITPDTEGALLDIGDFITADKIGDDGTALARGELGEKMGFRFFRSNHAPSIPTGSTVVTGAVNLSAGYAVGTTDLAVNGFSTKLTPGSWCTIAGDMTPQKIVARTPTTGSTTAITIAPGLRYAVVHTAVVTVYTPGAVNLVAGYAAGYNKTIVTDGFVVAPKKGQLTSFGVAAALDVYGQVDTPTTIATELDRSLEAAILNNDVIGIGPAGEYNFAFDRDAITLVVRPLAAPQSGTGASAAVANFNGLAIRVVITYDGDKQGHLVTCDVIAGVKTLNADLGCVMFG